MAVATLAGIATVIWAEPIAEVLSRSDPEDVATYLRIFGPFIPLATAATIALAGTRGFGTMRPFVAIQSIATPALKPVLILLAAIGGLTVTGLALGWVLPEAFACAAALVVLGASDPREPGAATEPATASIGALAREFWAFSAPRGVAAAFQITIIWFDLLLLSHLRDASEVGIYGAASRAVTIGTFALQAIRLAIAPQISRLLARGDRDQAQTVYQTATWWLIVVSWPLFLTLAIFGPALLGVFGPGFDQGATALAILSCAMLVNLGTGNVTVVLLMGGKSSWNLLNTAVALVLERRAEPRADPALRDGGRGHRLGGLDHRGQPDGADRGVALPRDAPVRPRVPAGGDGHGRLLRRGRAGGPRRSWARPPRRSCCSS